MYNCQITCKSLWKFAKLKKTIIIVSLFYDLMII